jgi:hypothetical protein
VRGKPNVAPRKSIKRQHSRFQRRVVRPVNRIDTVWGVAQAVHWVSSSYNSYRAYASPQSMTGPRRPIL